MKGIGRLVLARDGYNLSWQDWDKSMVVQFKIVSGKADFLKRHQGFCGFDKFDKSNVL